ncbi:MAG: hypothetical protein OEY14_13965 [Myxococcales bacterium]|nr:hypothetical protein [Myxococcales bacterium]
MSEGARWAVMACVLGAGLTACAPRGLPRITRVLDGERQLGSFVTPEAYEAFVRAELARARHELPLAATLYARARRGSGGDPLVIARLAEVQHARGLEAEADALLAAGLAADPASEALRMAAGRLAEARGELDQAIASFQRAAEAAPRSALGPLALARVLERLGSPGRAEGVLISYLGRIGGRSVEAARARLALATRRGDLPGTLSAARALLELAPSRAREIRALAAERLEGAEPGIAAALLDSLPERDRDEGLRVQALLLAGQRVEADALLAAGPSERLGGWISHAGLLLEAGNAAGALRLLEEASRGAPSRQASMLRARALLRLDRPAEAAESLVRIPQGIDAEGRALLRHALEARGLGGLGAEQGEI